jgi:hypothetical protein
MPLKKTPLKTKTPRKKTPHKKTPRKKTPEDGAVAAIEAVLRALDKVEHDVGRLEDCARQDAAQAS